MREDLLAQFGRRGIARERVAVGFHGPPWDTLRGIDITLDRFPHNAGTTLFESLYMGVPVVTLAGQPGVGRIDSSVLQGPGRAEWIAHTAATGRRQWRWQATCRGCPPSELACASKCRPAH